MSKFWKKVLPGGVYERIRQAILFRSDDPNNLIQILPQKQVNCSVERIKGFRFPAPGSQPAPRVPIRETTDHVFDINQYPRDPRNLPRNEETYINASAGPKEIDNARVKKGSVGQKNPAVMQYDPSGLRTTMTANWAALDKAVANIAPNHLPAPVWQTENVDIDAECLRKGMPFVVGKRYQQTATANYYKVRW